MARYEGLGAAENAWLRIAYRTDEIFVAHEAAAKKIREKAPQPICVHLR